MVGGIDATAKSLLDFVFIFALKPQNTRQSFLEPWGWSRCWRNENDRAGEITAEAYRLRKLVPPESALVPSPVSPGVQQEN
jgi:hypothetical protein